MRLAFCKGLVRGRGQTANGAFFDWLICRWTHSPYSHVELVFDASRDTLRQIALAAKTVLAGDALAQSSLCYSSSPQDNGCRFKWIDLDPAQWNFVEIPAAPAVETAAVNRAIALDGLRYDWPGIFGFVLPAGEHDGNDRFCSEVCAEILQGVGLLSGYKPWRLSPGQLYTLALKKE